MSAQNVGTFQLADGTITVTVGSAPWTSPFQVGADSDGEYFDIAKARYLPLRMPRRGDLPGTWLGSGERHVFRADGTWETGFAGQPGAGALAAGQHGTWELNGYQLFLRPVGAAQWTVCVGATGALLVINNILFQRQ
jgi:hypothetical protein